MSFIQWVGFVERCVLDVDIQLYILNQQENKLVQADKFQRHTWRYKGEMISI